MSFNHDGRDFRVGERQFRKLPFSNALEKNQESGIERAFTRPVWAEYLTPLPSNVNANLPVGSIPTFLIRSDSFGRHQSWERDPRLSSKDLYRIQVAFSVSVLVA